MSTHLLCRFHCLREAAALHLLVNSGDHSPWTKLRLGPLLPPTSARPVEANAIISGYLLCVACNRLLFAGACCTCRVGWPP